MRQYIQNYPFLSSLLINLGLFLLFLGIFYTRFGTTDDLEMQMVLAGKGILQESSPHLRWTHIFIGQILSNLYSYFPNSPWYGIYLTAAHLWGTTAILYSILILKFSLFRISIYILCFVLGEISMLQELQFTSSALVLGTGAVFLLFSAISNPNDKRRFYWYGLSFLMLCFVEMMRWNSFQLIVILGTPLLLYGIFQQQQKRIKNLAYCVFILIAAWGIEQSHYLIQNQNQKWANYNTYKHALSAHDILDYNKPQYLWTSSTADDYFYKVGWEYEDLMLFKHWFFADSTVFGLKQFKALQASFQNCPYPQEHIQQRLWQFFVEFPMEDTIFYAFLVLGICLMLLRGNRWVYLLLIVSFGFVFTILVFLFLYKHLPTRVSYPMGFYLIALAALFMTYEKEISRQTKVHLLIIIGLMVLSSLKMVTSKSSQFAIKKMHWSAALDSLNAKPEQLYIGGGDFYMHETMTPYQNLNDSMFMHFNMLDFGHFANSPNHYKQLDNFGIKNIHTEAPLDTNIYIIHRYGAPFLSWYANFVYRHYNMHIEYELVRREENINIAVYQIKEQIREQPNSQGVSLSNMQDFGIKPSDPNKYKADPTKPKAGYLEEELFYFAR